MTTRSRSATRCSKMLLLLCAIVALASGEEHEIVYPRMIVGRSGEKRLLFRAFDQDFHLRLEPTDVLAKGFVMITRDDKGNEAFLKPDVERWRHRILQDRNTGSTVVIDEGPLHVKGVINEELRIEPALDQIGDGRQDFAKRVPHRVIKINPRENEGNVFDEIVPPGFKPNATNSTPPDTRRSEARTVELAIVTDKLHSEALGSDKATLEYVCVICNSVNMRFSTMENARVIFKLVGVKRNLASSDQPYIENNMFGGYAMGVETVANFGQHFREKGFFKNADICHLVMKQQMALKTEGSNEVNPNLAGIAYVGGVCDGYKYGMSEDDAYRYSGCSTVAHELCHNLGGPHDGDPPPSYIPGSPGASSCPWDDGFVMSYVQIYPNKYHFSKCSEECVQHMCSIAPCLSTQNVMDAPSTNNGRLPGEAVMDSTGIRDRKSYYERRCQDIRSDLYLMEDTNPGEDCQYLCRTATDKDGLFYYWNCRSMDGEPCYEGKICKNGVCS